MGKGNIKDFRVIDSSDLERTIFYITDNQLEDIRDLEHGQPFPLLDIFENEKELCIQFEVPGVRTEDMDIAIQGDELTLKIFKKDEIMEQEEVSFLRMERKFGGFKRTVRLPVPCDTGSARAVCSKGVLHISFNKVADKRGIVKKINIK
ncbi:MAG: Hsp20/alpha crystallin family protein [Candidatus Schekmanbacteria bacterium]|nr:Hsp20/alpha crystallin family protein [Candidatus Schekmanbacteria bacterium]